MPKKAKKPSEAGYGMTILEFARRQRQWSTLILAEKEGLSVSTIYHLESESMYLKIGFLSREKLSKVLGLSVEVLFPTWYLAKLKLWQSKGKKETVWIQAFKSL